MQRERHSLMHRYRRTSIVTISLIVLLLDLIFVAINYRSARDTLKSSLIDRALNHRKEFSFSLQMTYRNMMQMSRFISSNAELNRIFLNGKNAVAREGGGAGGEAAQKYRLELLGKVKPAWDKLSDEFDVRQLHYQLGPGSLSFLRVHVPDRYGDRMDDVRFTIVDTNAEKTPRSGFETGRIYSGLRSVSPVWADDPQSGERVYVGALEAGTSFKQILPLFGQTFQIELAVLLDRKHVEKNMWPEFIQRYFSQHPGDDFYLEATTSEQVRQILPEIRIADDFKADRVQMISLGQEHISVYYFPLRDYRGTLDPELPPAGLVMLWENVSPLVAEFRSGLKINIIFAVVGFLIIEVILVWAMKRENRLLTAEKNAELDSLTGVYNRRYFDRLLELERNRSRRSGQPLSLIVCDIDFFKYYNDRYGHQAGDLCLKKVSAALLKEVRRECDCVARYGGEEFVIVLPHTGLKSAVRMAETMRMEIEALAIPHDGSEISNCVTCSFGVASTESLTDDEDLFEVADRQLYRAKQSGRHRVEPDAGGVDLD